MISTNSKITSPTVPRYLFSKNQIQIQTKEDPKLIELKLTIKRLKSEIESQQNQNKQ